jgi:ferritin-like metal-binding protein YciE
MLPADLRAPFQISPQKYYIYNCYNIYKVGKMAFAALLQRIYLEEVHISNLIRSILLNFDDDEIWRTFFQLLGDTCEHMDTIIEVVKLLGHDTKQFKEEALAGFNIQEVEFSDEFIPGIFYETLKWERYAHRFYGYLLEYLTANFERSLSHEIYEKIKELIHTIMNEEEEHIIMLEKLLASYTTVPAAQ